MIEKRFGPLRSTGYYVTDFVSGPKADEFFQDSSLTKASVISLSEKFVDLFALFKSLGIHHGDCKATNFLIKDDSPWVLDLDAMCECSSPERFKKLYRVDKNRFLLNWQTHPELQRWFDDHLPR